VCRPWPAVGGSLDEEIEERQALHDGVEWKDTKQVVAQKIRVTIDFTKW
jgi:hypothetical protein